MPDTTTALTPGADTRASSPADLAAHRRGLLVVKVLYALYFGAMGIYFTFLNVYFRSIGLSGTEIGLLSTVAPLVGIFAGTVWGLLSDRLGQTRRLLVIASAGAILSVLALSTARTFVVMIPLVAIYSLFNSAIMPLVDSTTLALLGEHRERYGAQRIWGSIGFIITSSASGFIVDALGLHIIFAGYAVAIGLHLVMLFLLPQQPVELRGSMLRGLTGLVRQPAWVLFTFSVMLIATAGYAMGAFLSVTVKSLGGSDSLVGLSWTVAAISELPIMAGSAWLFRKVGPARLLVFAFLAYTIRMFLYSTLAAPEWVLAINCMGGISFALYWVSSVTYASQLAPANLKATSQGMLATASNLAGMIGSALAGWLFDLRGPSGLFQVMALICATALAVFVSGRLLMRRRTRAGQSANGKTSWVSETREV